MEKQYYYYSEQYGHGVRGGQKAGVDGTSWPRFRVGPHMITCPPALWGEQGPSIVGCRPVLMREALRSWSGGLSAQLRLEWLAKGAGVPSSMASALERWFGANQRYPFLSRAPGSGCCWSGLEVDLGWGVLV